MANRTIDPNLLAQLEDARERLSQLLSAEGADHARCLELIHRLDRLAIALGRGELDELVAAGEVSQVARQLESLASGAGSLSATSLIRETLATPTPGRRARNQARLVEHLLGQPDALATDAGLSAAQHAVASYAQRPADDALPPVADLQARLSRAVQTQVEAAAGRAETRLLRRDELGALRAAVDSGVSLDALSVGQASVHASASLQQDLTALIDRFSLRDASARIDEGELILAHVETDADGQIRRVDLHDIERHASAPTAPRASTARAQATPPSAPDAAALRSEVTTTIATEAAAAAARERLQALRARLTDHRALAAEQRDALELEQQRVVDLEARAAEQRARLEGLRADEAHRARIDQLTATTRAAARDVLREQATVVRDLATLYAHALRESAERAPDEAARATLKGESARAALLTERLAHADADVSTIAQDLGAQIASQVTGGALTPSATAALSDTPDRLAQASDRARVARAAAFIAPVPDAPQAEPVTQISDEAREAARLQLQHQAQRFSERSYDAARLEEHILAVEQPFEALFGRLDDRTRPTPLRGPAPPRLAALTAAPRLDLTTISAEAADHLQRLQGLEHTHNTPSVDLYDASAGLELTPSAARALSARDRTTSAEGAGLVQGVLQRAFAQLSDVQRRAATLARSAGLLSTSDSGRRDLGLPTPERHEMQPGAAPLFKRKKGLGSHDDELQRVIMPALHDVAEMTPLRARPPARGDEGAGQQLGRLGDEAQALRHTQRQVLASLERLFGNEHPRVPGMQALDAERLPVNRQLSRHLSALEQWSEAQLKRSSPQHTATDDMAEARELATSLRSEAQGVPQHVIDRLHPMLRADFGAIRLYTGSRAAAVADRLGANAFTLNKAIFGAMNLSSVEGLSLFAHEAVHTTHFDAPGTVDQKEAEAEAMEARVVSALSEGRRELALERRSVSGAAVRNGEVLRSSGGRDVQADTGTTTTEGRHRFDAPDTIEMVADLVYERFLKSVDREMKRLGLTKGRI